MRVDCSGFDAGILVANAMHQLERGEQVTLHGEGKFVSTVALAVALLKKDFPTTCAITSATTHPEDLNPAGELSSPVSLTVKLQPACTTPLSTTTDDNLSADKRVSARKRSFTTLRSAPAPPTIAVAEPPAPPSPPAQPVASSDSDESVREDDDDDEEEEDVGPELTPEEIDTAVQHRDPSHVDFHSLFHSCCVTGKRPADRLFLHNWKAFSVEEAQRHAASNPEACIALCYDLSDYSQSAWNYRYNRWATVNENEHYDDILEALFTTKGSFMTEAVTDKETAEMGGEFYRCATCSMQGWRASNEDAHAAIPSLANHPNIGYFGVYDGHGGWRVAEFASKHLHNVVDEKLPSDLTSNFEAVKEAVGRAFLEMDDLLLQKLPQEHTGATGATANVVLIQKKEAMVVANAGDSRAVMCKGGKAVRLSEDHKPTCEGELSRIKASGSRVAGDGRVEGLLAVSRALGDFDFKQAGALPPEAQAVTAFPDVSLVRLDGDEEFVILACDGIWDVMSDEEVVAFVRSRLATGMNLKDICTSLCDECLAPTIEDEGLGTDNMSLILVVFS